MNNCLRCKQPIPRNWNPFFSRNMTTTIIRIERGAEGGSLCRNCADQFDEWVKQ